MLFRLHFLLYCICFSYNQFLFSFLHFILCRMCVCHMFSKVLTYLLETTVVIDDVGFPSVLTEDSAGGISHLYVLSGKCLFLIVFCCYE